MGHVALFGFIASVPSWLVLAAIAGNEGLQRSVSAGASTLLSERPAAGLAAIATTLALAWLAAPLLRGRSPLLAPLAVLAWNLVAGLVLAPLAVGELEPVHAPLVVAATTVCGLALVAAWAGAWPRLRSRRAVGRIDARDGAREADAT